MSITEKHFCYIARYKETNEWVDSETCIYDENDQNAIEALREYLSDPDKYVIEFRECNECENFTLRDAYDLAVAHPNDYFEPADMAMFAVTGSADSLIFDHILADIADYEGLTDWDGEKVLSFDYKSWNREMSPFLWDRVLDPEESKSLCQKYDICRP